MERIEQYDKAKGIGMILVIYGHLFIYGGIPFSIIFAFHMPLFFFISGMLVKIPTGGGNIYKTWLKQTIVRYFIPLIFFSTFGGIVRILIYGLPNIKRLLGDFYLHMSSDELLTGAIWFLWILAVVMYALLFLVKWEKGYIERRITIVVTLCVISYVSSRIPITLPLLLKTVSTALLFVFVGYISKGFVLTWSKNKRYRRICFFSLPLFLLLVVLNKTINVAVPSYQDFFVFLICSFFGIALTMYVANYKMPSMIRYLGKNSLIVFSLHGLWIKIIIDLYNFFMGTSYRPMVDLPYEMAAIIGAFVIFMCIISIYIVKPIYNFIYNKAKMLAF